MSRIGVLMLVIQLGLLAGCSGERPADVAEDSAAAPRWNILFVFADDYGRFAGHYSGLDGRDGPNDVLDTPHMDRLAAEGVVFRNAFVSSPSCTPSRSALFSGRHFFNTGRGAILRPAEWDARIPAYPDRLMEAGYFVGKSLKAWSPGTPVDAPIGGEKYAFESAGTDANSYSTFVTEAISAGADPETAGASLLAEVRRNFSEFLDANPDGKPWHYFFGPLNTHRPWIRGSGEVLWGIEPDSLRGRLPGYLPDVPQVREDVSDYLGEVQALDAYIGVLVAELESRGELDSTLILLSGDHGMPGIPHGKATLYDGGTRVALTARVPGAAPGRVIDDFVSLSDLAPTFVEVAGARPLPAVYGRSVLAQLTAREGGQVLPSREFVIIGRERHMDRARPGFLPYPQRAIRTGDYLYIRNFAPDRWPMGIPSGTPGIPAYADMDGGPTKSWLLENKESAPEFYDLAFGKRPVEELYDLRTDPDQLNNLADEPSYLGIREDLSRLLIDELKAAGDPRVTGDGKAFDRAPFTDVSNSSNRFFEMGVDEAGEQD